ncbi:MAG: hypothetical protein IKQ72_01150 [Bacteroidaceae bacterium]|nr:hypothetical protein [Bacteroidaceae bacterium]
MRKKLLFLFASTMMTVGASAVEWEKPIPAHQDLVYGDTVYLYNRDGKGFFLGGNTYGTHASIGPEGYKCIFDNTELGVTFRDSVESKSKWFNVYAHFETGDCWVDWADNGDIYFDVVKQDDGSYQIFSHSSFNVDSPLGIDANGDNLTYVKFTDPEFASVNYISWWIVSKEAYNQYWVKNSIYENALALENKIGEAADLGLTEAVKAATAVYENAAATLDEMKAANETLQAAINNFKENQVTPDNPQDLTETYIPEADFESNQGAGVWQRTHKAQNYQTNGTAGKLGDQTTFLEAWNGDPFSGKQYVPITGLPNGVYEFTLSAATNGGNGCYVYAGNSRVEVTSGDMTSYTVYAQVTDGTLEVGLDMPKTIQNWVGIDDAKLVYLGNSVASYAYWMNNVIENSARYDEEETFAQVSLIKAYNAFLDTDLSQFTTVDEILAFNEQFAAAQASLSESLSAYAKFHKIVEQISDIYDDGYEGAAADELFDSYDEGEIFTIISEKNLSTEEILAKCEEINKALDVVKKTCLLPGSDCTNLLVNPNFDERLTGWEHDKSMADGKVDGLPSNLNCERWNDNFDFYQVVTGVPNGVYELSVQAFYRPTDDTKKSYENYVNGVNDEILASIYVNSLTTPVKNIAEHTYDENLENNSTDLGNGLFCPNGQNSASNAFTKGDYQNVVFGIVTDGVLKVGIKSKGTVEGRWTIWDNFRLTYLGKDANAVSDVIKDRANDATKYTSAETYVYGVLKEAVDAAYAKAMSATGDDKFAAIEEFVQALDAAKENEAIYKEIAKQMEDLNDAYEKTVSTNDELLKASNKLYQDLEGGYNDLSFSTEEGIALLEKAYEYSAKLRMPDYNGASEESVDFTSVIINPSFEENKKDEESLKGWVNEGSIKMKAQDNSSFGKTGDVYCEKWHANGNVNLHQTLKYLPNGYYTLSVDAFCEAENAVIFANDKEIEFSNKDNSGSPATESISLQVTDGTLTFGVRVELTDQTWVCVDNFQLIYHGETVPTAIDEVAAETAADAKASEFFTVSGARADKLGKGINIVRMSDGTVKKVFVK